MNVVSGAKVTFEGDRYYRLFRVGERESGARVGFWCVIFFFLDFSFLGFLFQRRETEGDDKIPSRCFHTLLVRERNREKGDVFSLFFVLAYVKDLKSLRKANEYDFFGTVNLFI
jgi:hypothetical protein